LADTYLFPTMFIIYPGHNQDIHYEFETQSHLVDVKSVWSFTSIRPTPTGVMVRHKDYDTF